MATNSTYYKTPHQNNHTCEKFWKTSVKRIQKELTETIEHSINQSAIVTVLWCINLLLHAHCVVI